MRPTTTSATPPRASAGRPLRTSSVYHWHREHEARSGEVGWERVKLVREQRRGRRRGSAPRGWAGMHWSPAIGPSAGHRERAGLFDESSFAKLEVSGRAPPTCSSACATTAWPERWAGSPTRRCSTAGGIECDFTVTRVEEEVFSIVTGTAFGNHDASWIRRHLPPDGSVRLSDVTSRWACFALWARRPPNPGAVDPTRWSSATCRCASYDRRRPRASVAGDLRGRVGLGAVLPADYGPGCGGRCGRRVSLTGSWLPLPGDRRAAPGEGLSRLGRRHHCGPDPDRGWSGLLRARRQAVSWLQGARRATAAAALPGARRPALGGAGQRAGASRRSDLRPGHQRGYGYAVGHSNRLCLPAAQVGLEEEGAGRHLRRWVGGHVLASRCFDPDGERCAPPLR